MRMLSTVPFRGRKGHHRLPESLTGPGVGASPALPRHVPSRPGARMRGLERLVGAILDASPIGVRIDALDVCLYANPAFRRLFGSHATDPAPRLWRRLITSNSAEEMMQRQQAWLAGAERPSPYEASFRMGADRLVHVAAWPSVIEHAGKRAVLTFVVDATAERALRSQLLQAQKMEAIGSLAGGVAHDFANLIQAVRGNAELLLLERAPQGAGRTEIEEILRVTDRASELTSQLLTVSRRIDGKPRTIDANAEAAKAQRLLARVLPKTVAIDLRLAPGTLMVEADPLQIGQVLMNLAVNARDAMPEGGRLRIATNKTTLDEARCRTRPGLQPGKYVRLAVADTGCGMPAEAMEHIFEPFFTTKPAGRGTGLGLSIVYGIVKKHRGYIECTSEVGTGTEFRIYLPRVKAVAAAPAPERKEQAVRGGAETVLLVEDEDSVRAIAQRMLQRAGYTVLSAPNGEAALSLFEVRRDRIGLVVLDLQMPGMGGRRCLERLRELSPDLRVIITTGAAPDPATESALQQDAQSVITKPYSLHTLLATVRSVLDARANGGAEREEAR